MRRFRAPGGVAILLVSQFCFAHGIPKAVEKELPAALKESLLSGISRLMDCEKVEDWACQADLQSDLLLRGSKKADWVRVRQGSGSFFGKRLVGHRVERIYSYGIVGNDEETGVMVSGCAKLRGQKKGYQTLIEAFREHGEWRFVGPYTVSEIDGPAKQCRF